MMSTDVKTLTDIFPSGAYHNFSEICLNRVCSEAFLGGYRSVNVYLAHSEFVMLRGWHWYRESYQGNLADTLGTGIAYYMSDSGVVAKCILSNDGVAEGKPLFQYLDRIGRK